MPPLKQQPIIDKPKSHKKAKVEGSALPSQRALESNNFPSSSAVDANSNGEDALQRLWEKAGFVAVHKRKMDAADSVKREEAVKPLSKNARKKLKRQKSAEQNPIIVLSRYAQEKGNHLVYERLPIGDLNDEWIVLVKLDGRRIGQGNGISIKDGDEKAAIAALEELKIAPWFKDPPKSERQAHGDSEGHRNRTAGVKAPPDGSQYITLENARANMYMVFPPTVYKIKFVQLSPRHAVPLRMILHIRLNDKIVEEMEGVTARGTVPAGKDQCALNLLQKLGYAVRP
jgi:hypothetical protein